MKTVEAVKSHFHVIPSYLQLTERSRYWYDDPDRLSVDRKESIFLQSYTREISAKEKAQMNRIYVRWWRKKLRIKQKACQLWVQMILLRIENRQMIYLGRRAIIDSIVKKYRLRTGRKKF